MRLSRFTNKNNNKPSSKKIRRRESIISWVQESNSHLPTTFISSKRTVTVWNVMTRMSCSFKNFLRDLSLTLFFFFFSKDRTGSWLGNKKRMEPWCYDEASRWRDYGGPSAVHSAATAAGRRRSLWHRREPSIFYFGYAEVRSGACLFTPKRSLTKDRPCKSIQRFIVCRKKSDIHPIRINMLRPFF